MSVQVRTGPSTDIWTIDATPKAARVILYNAAGSVLSVSPSTQITARTSQLIYRYVLADKAGQASSYNFVALHNPLGSGKSIALLSCEVQNYGVTFVAATKNSTKLFHSTTAPTGGADDTASIARLLSSQAAPVATVTITSPTVTGVGALIKGFGAGGMVGAAAGIYSTFDVGYRANQEDYQFVAPAGEGFLLRQTVSGATDQTYCFTLEWAEYTP
jgi:hypothetical protein